MPLMPLVTIRTQLLIVSVSQFPLSFYTFAQCANTANEPMYSMAVVAS